MFKPLVEWREEAAALEWTEMVQEGEWHKQYYSPTPSPAFTFLCCLHRLKWDIPIDLRKLLASMMPRCNARCQLPLLGRYYYWCHSEEQMMSCMLCKQNFCLQHLHFICPGCDQINSFAVGDELFYCDHCDLFFGCSQMPCKCCPEWQLPKCCDWSKYWTTMSKLRPCQWICHKCVFKR